MNNRCVALFATLIFSATSVFAQEPVSFDGSQSQEMQVVWKRMEAFAFGGYFQNVADIPGNNFVSMFKIGTDRTWPKSAGHHGKYCPVGRGGVPMNFLRRSTTTVSRRWSSSATSAFFVPLPTAGP